MNVWETNKRSWRKARKRAVSPIIATILLVAITVVLAAVLYVLISGLTHGPGNSPIGSAFSAGAPISSKCAAGGTFATTGCLAADYVYTLTIESSTVTFGSVLFEVKTSTGTITTITGPGGFSILPISGAPVAQFAVATGGAMAMTSTGWTYTAPTGSSSSLTNLYTIVIDMGTVNPTGTGLTFVAIGTGSYTGTTTPISLP
jgi:archaeal type IV pilus assembly protein PilA